MPPLPNTNNRFPNRLEIDKLTIMDKKITISLPSELIDELIDVSPAKSKTEAVLNAVKDEIRKKKKARIKELAGRIEFVKGAEDLRYDDRRFGKGPL